MLVAHSGDRGFALPLSIGLGMVMLLATLTIVLKSSQDRGSASTQQATGKSQSIAEVGVTRYQSFLANNPGLTVYSDCQGARNSSGVCPDTVTTPSWSNTGSIPGVTGSTEIASAAQTNWQNVASDSSQGQFRLLSYVFRADDASKPTAAPGTGTLIVEGRVNQSTAGTEDIGTSTARLEVSTRVQSQGTLPPGLRVNEPSFPSLPPEGQLVNVPPTGVCTITTQLGSRIASSITFTPNNCPSASGTYYTYHFKNDVDLYLGSGVHVTVDAPGQTIKWYVEGDLKLHHDPSTLKVTPGTNLVIYAHGTVLLKESASIGGPLNNSGSPDSLQIYKYSTDELKITGGSNFNAFIFAPTSQVTVSEADPIRGVIWAKAYENRSASFVDKSADVNCSNLPSGFCTGGKNQMTSISSWQRKSR